MKVFMFEYTSAEWADYVARRKWRKTDDETGTSWLEAPDMVLDVADDGTTVTVNAICETKKPITAAMWDHLVLPVEPMRVFAGHEETPYESIDDMPAAQRTRVKVAEKLVERQARKDAREAERVIREAEREAERAAREAERAAREAERAAREAEREAEKPIEESPAPADPEEDPV